MDKTIKEKIPASGLTIHLTQVPFVILVIYGIFFVLLVYACYLSIPIFSVFLCSVLIILAYSQRLLRKDLLRSHPLSIKTMLLSELGGCVIQLNRGDIIKLDINMNSILSEQLVILNFTEHSEDLGYFRFLQHYSVLLTAQELGYEPFRQVKRYLRLINFFKKED